MLPTIDCVNCEGSGKAWNTRYGNRSEIEQEFEAVRNIEEGTCSSCKGFGILSRRMHSAYKTETMANRYRGTKAAMKCYSCKGEKVAIYCEVLSECYTCSGTGKKIAYDRNEDVVPAEVNLYDHVPKQFMKDYYAGCDIFLKLGGHTTWNDANLGLGSLASVTDYGRKTDRFVALTKEHEDVKDAISIFKDEMRAELVEKESFTQLINLVIDKEARKIGHQLVVTLKTGGYTIQVAGKEEEGYLLPPTYTPEVLNKPWA